MEGVDISGNDFLGTYTYTIGLADCRGCTIGPNNTAAGLPASLAPFGANTIGVTLNNYAGSNFYGTITPNVLNGINWIDIHNIGGTNVNWTSVKAFTKSGGTASGVNWQDFGV
jgi:hypothetical protein